jgi:hypothetical protein
MQRLYTIDMLLGLLQSFLVLFLARNNGGPFLRNAGQSLSIPVLRPLLPAFIYNR